MIINNDVAIILNGTSSSGKSSIAHRIVDLLDVPIVYAQLDTFHGMFDFSKFNSGSDALEASKVAFSLFDDSIKNIRNHKYPVVIDTVFERIEYFQNTMGAVKGRHVFLVGIHCPLEEVCIREKIRGDRRVGLAGEQFDDVHVDKHYDLELDTSKLSSSDCAVKIIRHVNRHNV